MNEEKKRHGCINVWLWLIIIVSMGGCIFYAISMFDYKSSIESLGEGILAILMVVNILGAIMLMRWNKYGFYLLVINQILACVVNTTMLLLDFTTCLIAPFVILIWWAILHIKKDGLSAWSLLETGWDYKHCRHLYQLFAILVGVFMALTILAYSRNFRLYPYDYADIDSIAYDDLIDTVAVEADVEWQTFSDANNTCSIEAPSDFQTAELNTDQILGIMCTDFDPAALVICETASSLKGAGISTTKDYANVLVKMARNAEGAKGFNKISEEAYGENSYLIVYNMSVDGTQFRYSILASRTKANFYCCQVFCLEEYAEQLEPTVSHMLSSFKALE